MRATVFLRFHRRTRYQELKRDKTLYAGNLDRQKLETIYSENYECSKDREE